MLPALSDVLVVQIHKIPDIEGHQAAFFLDGKRKLFTVGFPFSFQILGVNNIEPPLPQRVGQARVDIFVQKQFQFHRPPLLPCGRRLNLALPVFDITRLFQIRIDLVLMVKIIGQS